MATTVAVLGTPVKPKGRKPRLNSFNKNILLQEGREMLQERDSQLQDGNERPPGA